MSTFAKYLTESTKTYEYKVKIAGDIEKDFATRLETALAKLRLRFEGVIGIEISRSSLKVFKKSSLKPTLSGPNMIASPGEKETCV